MISTHLKRWKWPINPNADIRCGAKFNSILRRAEPAERWMQDENKIKFKLPKGNYVCSFSFILHSNAILPLFSRNEWSFLMSSVWRSRGGGAGLFESLRRKRVCISRGLVARAELMEEEKSNNENHPGSYCETFLPTIIKFCIRRRRL